MSDLISRKDAINAIIKQNGTVDKSVAKRILIQLPSAEPKTAVWVGEGDGYVDGEIILDTWYCSNCDYLYDYEEKPNWKYCPNCGAKMEVTE